MIAESTDNLFTLFLMLEAVPNSSASIFCTWATCDFGGKIREIMLVPFLHKC